jgi:hypothetical protein
MDTGRYVSCLKALPSSSSFSDRSLRTTARIDTLLVTGAEDKPLLGSKLSADSGARPSWGSQQRAPAIKSDSWDGINALNPRGKGTESPKRLSLSVAFVRTAHFQSVLSSEPCLRLQLLHEPIPPLGCRNHYSASRASYIAALTRASTKEPVAASRAARDKPPAW